MGKTTLILASILAATTSIAADWFVAKDGDDANSGASRAEAKATIPAACACLSSPGGATDLAGNRRIIDNIVDIGCYERDRPKPTQFLCDRL